jgi:hypothetical protein
MVLRRRQLAQPWGAAPKVAAAAVMRRVSPAQARFRLTAVSTGVPKLRRRHTTFQAKHGAGFPVPEIMAPAAAELGAPQWFGRRSRRLEARQTVPVRDGPSGTAIAFGAVLKLSWALESWASA